MHSTQGCRSCMLEATACFLHDTSHLLQALHMPSGAYGSSYGTGLSTGVGSYGSGGYGATSMYGSPGYGSASMYGRPAAGECPCLGHDNAFVAMKNSVLQQSVQLASTW